jgi:hypothetical protein
MADLRTRLKISFMLSAIGVAIACFVASVYYSHHSEYLTTQIAAEQDKPASKDKPKSDAVIAAYATDRETSNKRGEQMFDLFTHVLTGFLGLAISASSDLIGLAGSAASLPANPPPAGSGGPS